MICIRKSIQSPNTLLSMRNSPLYIRQRLTWNLSFPRRVRGAEATKDTRQPDTECLNHAGVRKKMPPERKLMISKTPLRRRVGCGGLTWSLRGHATAWHTKEPDGDPLPHYPQKVPTQPDFRLEIVSSSRSPTEVLSSSANLMKRFTTRNPTPTK